MPLDLTDFAMYTGIGGAAVAAHVAGIRAVAFCEQDAYCRRVLKRHWPDVPIFESDEDVTADAFRQLGIPFPTIVSGGPPCQGFSVAGKRKGAEDPRNRWPFMRRAVAELRPAWVVVENVPPFVSYAQSTVIPDLEALGYECFPPVVYPVCAFGAPHERFRAFVVAYADRSQPCARRGDDGKVRGLQEAQCEPEHGAFVSGRSGSAGVGLCNCLNCELTGDIGMPISKEEKTERNRLRWVRIRKEVLGHYSNGTFTCACCGEGHYEFLALDHINGGGLEERKRLGTRGRWRWIQTQGYPGGYQVLCHNCNSAKYTYGECPHETERRMADANRAGRGERRRAEPVRAEHAAFEHGGEDVADAGAGRWGAAQRDVQAGQFNPAGRDARMGDALGGLRDGRADVARRGEEERTVTDGAGETLGDSQERGPRRGEASRQGGQPALADEGARTRDAEPRLGGNAGRFARWLDGARWPLPPGPDQHAWEPPRLTSVKTNRVARLKGLGNIAVPVQLVPIFAAIAAVEEENQ